VLPGVVTVGGGGVTTTELGAGAVVAGGAVFTEHAPRAIDAAAAVTTAATFNMRGSSPLDSKRKQAKAQKPRDVTFDRGQSSGLINPSHT
jgi:hypothetical protein